MKPVVISLFDYTGEAVKPWAEAGFDCLCFDLQHTGARTEGRVTFLHWDSDGPHAADRVLEHVSGRPVAFLFAFPPCTDLAASGAKHWASKLAADPQCQRRAVSRALKSCSIARVLGCPYMIENPNGALSTLWRKADHSFNPCDFGGYLDASPHPIWPEYIPAQDAYTKRTRLWTGLGFNMPEARPVEPVTVERTKRNGKVTRSSPQWAKLGGKSVKTKNIRSATPRGFSRAVFLANSEAAA